MKHIHFALRRLGGLFGLLAIGALTLVFATSAMAGGGYIGPGPAVITVQEASQNQYMDKMVSLRGQITQYTGVDRSIAGANDVYSFTDSTGTIKLVIPAINQDIWMGKYVDSADTVEVSGKLDRVGSGTIILYVRRIVKR